MEFNMEVLLLWLTPQRLHSVAVGDSLLLLCTHYVYSEKYVTVIKLTFTLCANKMAVNVSLNAPFGLNKTELLQRCTPLKPLMMQNPQYFKNHTHT